MKKRVKLQAAMLAVIASSSYADESCLTDVENKEPLEVFQCFEAKQNRQQKQIERQQEKMWEQQEKIQTLTQKNQALKTEVEQLSKKQPNQTLPATTKNCTSEQTGQIRFDGTYARLCNGTHWQVIDARHPKPVLKSSAKAYTMAEVRETAKENLLGQGTICETGYHLCIFMEALVLKYVYPRSRIPYEGDYLRTLGTCSEAKYAGSTHPHNSLLGYKSGDWNGQNLQCPEGSGPLLHFYKKAHRSLGYEWDGGCYKDDKQWPWACCINNLD
jgi:hypothetical protein